MENLKSTTVYLSEDSLSSDLFKQVVEYKSERYKYIGRLLEVLEEEKYISKRELEKIIMEKGIILDVLAQERGLWNYIDEKRRRRSMRELAESYGVEAQSQTIFGVYMSTRAGEVLGEYKPKILRLQRQRLTAVSEHMIILKGVKSLEELNKVILRLMEGYLKFMKEATERLVATDTLEENEKNILKERVEALSSLDPRIIISPPFTGKEEQHPVVAVHIPFEYTMKALPWLSRVVGKEAIIESLLEEMLREVIELRGIRLHHIFKTVGCRNKEAVERLKKLEKKILKRLGYDSVLHLVKAHRNPAKAILEAIRGEDPETYHILEENCGQTLGELEQATKEISKVLL